MLEIEKKKKIKILFNEQGKDYNSNLPLKNINFSILNFHVIS